MKTLEEVLQEMGCKNPFLNDVKIDEEGYRQPFTVKGCKAYSKLVEILYAVGNLTEIDMSEVVERLDDIAEEL